MGSGGRAAASYGGDAAPVGGNGGGRLFLVARSLNVAGSINGDGGGGYAGDNGTAASGSGGAIWIMLGNGSLSGTGSITARGGGSSAGVSLGGGGRIAITGFSQNLFTGQLGPSGSTYLLAFDPLADDDGDGVSNANELIAGTDPGDAHSVLKLVVLRGTNSLRLQFPSVLTRFYQIQWRTSLTTGSWQALGSEMQGSGGLIEVTHPSNDANQRFYRVMVH